MSQLLRASLLISAGLLLGRVAGFVREAILASQFGVSAEADVAVLLITVPELLVNLLVAGGLSAALIPAFQSLSVDQRPALLIQSSLAITGAFALVTLVAVAAARPFVHLLAPGLSASVVEGVAPLLGLSLWVIPLTVLSGLAAAYLHAHQRFGAASLGTLIFNLVLIAGLVIAGTTEKPLQVFAVAVLAAGLIRWLSQVAALPKPVLIRQAFRHWHLKLALLRHYFQATSAATVLLLLPVIARALTSLTGEGGLASFNYAIKLVELPLGVCISAFAVAAFPKLASLASEDRPSVQFEKTLGQIFTIVTLIAVALTIPMITFCADFAEFIFGRGRMTDVGLEQIRVIASIILWSLPFQGIYGLLVIAFNARRDTLRPLLISIMGIVTFLLLVRVTTRLWDNPAEAVAITFVSAHAVMVLLALALASKCHGIHLLRQFANPDLLIGLLVISGITLLLNGGMMSMDLSAIGGVAVAGLSAIIGLGTTLLIRPGLWKNLRSLGRQETRQPDASSVG